MIALVTGASAGLGEEFARQLALRGDDLVLVARNEERLQELAKELPVQCEVLAADLTDRAQLANVERRVGSVDLLVNNAGYGSFGPFHTLDVEVETREVELNVLALVRLTYAAVAAMVPRGSGAILNVSSLAGCQPGPLNATYSATKAFVTSFTQAVHEEVRDTGVAVTVLCPGFTHTEFQERAQAPAGDVPGFMWQMPPEVVQCGLDAVAKNRAVAIPGAVNKVLGNLTAITPDAVTRRVSGIVMKRASH